MWKTGEWFWFSAVQKYSLETIIYKSLKPWDYSIKWIVTLRLTWSFFFNLYILTYISFSLCLFPLSFNLTLMLYYVKTRYSLFVLTVWSSYKRHPISSSVIYKALHELYGRHIPVWRLKLKHLHPNPQNKAHIARESACLM